MDLLIRNLDWKPAFLAALRQVPVVQRACSVVGIERCSAYRARARDPQFAADWEDAMEDGIDAAEAEAFRRAVTGFEEPVFAKGEPVWLHRRVVDEDGTVRYEQVLDDHGQPVQMTVRKHSDAMLALFLRGRRKKVYAERTEITGADGGPVDVVDDTARAARVASLLALAKSRQQAAPAIDLSDLV